MPVLPQEPSPPSTTSRKGKKNRESEKDTQSKTKAGGGREGSQRKEYCAVTSPTTSNFPICLQGNFESVSCIPLPSRGPQISTWLSNWPWSPLAASDKRQGLLSHLCWGKESKCRAANSCRVGAGNQEPSQEQGGGGGEDGQTRKTIVVHPKQENVIDLPVKVSQWPAGVGGVSLRTGNLLLRCSARYTKVSTETLPLLSRLLIFAPTNPLQACSANKANACIVSLAA